MSKENGNAWGIFILSLLVCAGIAYIGVYGMHEHAREHTAKIHPVKTANQPLAVTTPVATHHTEQLLVKDLLLCMRGTTIFAQPEQHPDNAPILPPVPKYQRLFNLEIGEDGWMTSLEAHQGKLYVLGYEIIMPVRTKATSGVYRDSTPDFFIHIRRSKNGVDIDCDQAAPEVFQPNSDEWKMIQDLSILPVTGMFHGNKK